MSAWVTLSAAAEQPRHGGVIADAVGGTQRRAVLVHAVRIGAVAEQNVKDRVGHSRLRRVRTGEQQYERRLGGSAAVGVGESVDFRASRQQHLRYGWRRRAALLPAELDPVGRDIMQQSRRMAQGGAVADYGCP